MSLRAPILHGQIHRMGARVHLFRQSANQNLENQPRVRGYCFARDKISPAAAKPLGVELQVLFDARDSILRAMVYIQHCGFPRSADPLDQRQHQLPVDVV